jgi:hypothetical protein
MIRFALLFIAAITHEPPSALPWVSGFRASAIAAESTRVRAPDGSVVIASAHGGLVLADDRGRVIARTGALPFEGSADDVVALAVGDAQLGAPVVLVAVQRGGHRISTVSLEAFRITGARLERVFAAPIELHDGNATATGAIAFDDGGLVYRAPSGRATTWRYDPVSGRYERR